MPQQPVDGAESGTMFRQVAALPQTFTAAAHEKLFRELLANGAVRFRSGKALVPFRITGNIDWGVPVLRSKPTMSSASSGGNPSAFR